MNIDIADYVSHEDMAEIARDEFSKAARRFFSDEKNVSRILANVVYQALFDATDDEILGVNAETVRKLIAKNVHKQINELSSYDVFRESRYGDSKSEGQKILDMCARENRPLIEARVRQLIAEIDGEKIGWILSDVIRSAFTGEQVQA